MSTLENNPVYVKLHPGTRYGRLSFIREISQRTKHGHILAEWQCACGKVTIAEKASVRSGNTTSCGCVRDETARNNAKINYLPPGESSFNVLFHAYKCGAKRRNLTFNLERQDFARLTKMQCFYCGCDPCQTTRYHDKNGDYTYNGVDRLDNSAGYEPGNVVASCKTCNLAKSVMTPLEFQAWVRRIYSVFGNKNLNTPAPI